MSVTIVAYLLFAVWAAVALAALVMTDLAARRNARAVRAEHKPLAVIARAGDTSTPAAAYRRASA